MQRSLLVQTLLNMATGSGGAKLEELVVDAAGTFDAGSGKGYNPVTVPSGSVNVLGEKGVVSNNSVVVTPKAQVVGGWVDSGETSGSGVGVTASELVSGTLNVSSDGVQDVTNYQNISVPSAGHSASAHKGVVTDHSIIVTPRSTATQGFVQAGTVEGTGIVISASELVDGTFTPTGNGTFDVSNYKYVEVSGIMQKTKIGEHSYTGSPAASTFVTMSMPVTINENFDALLLCGVADSAATPESFTVALERAANVNSTGMLYFTRSSSLSGYASCLYTCVKRLSSGYEVRYSSGNATSYANITPNTTLYLYSSNGNPITVTIELYGIKF